MNTLGEILDAYKGGCITRYEAVARIEMKIKTAEIDASLAMIDKFKADVAEVFITARQA